MLDPKGAFVSSGVPALVAHGDQDTYVSYDVARSVCMQRTACDFYTVLGSDHGFDSADREGEAIAATAGRLTRLRR